MSRDSWGDVSVLASCESAEDVRNARARGYQTAIVVESFATDKRHVLGDEAGKAAGVDVLPCPQQTRGVSCSDCKRCFDDEKLGALGYSIAFQVHGGGATVRRASKAIRTPNDPSRRFGTRELIPLVIADLEAKGLRPTNAAIAGVIDCSASSVAQMRKKFDVEAKS